MSNLASYHITHPKEFHNLELHCEMVSKVLSYAHLMIPLQHLVVAVDGLAHNQLVEHGVQIGHRIDLLDLEA